MANTSDFSKPVVTDNYVSVLPEISALALDLAKGLDSVSTSPANLPAGSKRWNANTNYWEKFDGTSWSAMTSIYNITVANVPWSGVTGKPTTVGGYGITDAVTQQTLLVSQPNIIPNSSGEFNGAFWSLPSGFNGSNGGSGDGYLFSAINQSVSTATAVSQMLPATPNNTYFFQGEVQVATLASGQFCLDLEFFDSSGTLIAANQAEQIYSQATAGWVTFGNSVVAPANTAGIKARFYFQNASGTAYVRKLKCALGSTATPYSQEANWIAMNDSGFAANFYSVNTSYSVTSPNGNFTTQVTSPTGNFSSQVNSPIGNFTNRILVGNGSAASPSIAFASDGAQDTGLYWVQDGQFAVTCNGNWVGTFSGGAFNIGGNSFTAGIGTFSGNVYINGQRLINYDGQCTLQNPANANGVRIVNQAYNAQIWLCDNAGNTTASGNVTAYSDERIKKNWKQLPDNFIELIARVKNGVYERTDTGSKGLVQVGVSAQSLSKAMPEAVIEDKDGLLSVSYGNAALAAVVELAKEIIAMRDRIEELELEVKAK